jgi:CheY-like chemotaxis protein
MKRRPRVLHLENSLRDAEIVRHRLDIDGLACDVLLASSKDSFEIALKRESFDLILSDYDLPGYDGLTALKQAQRTQPDVPVILISREQALREHAERTNFALTAARMGVWEIEFASNRMT